MREAVGTLDHWERHRRHPQMDFHDCLNFNIVALFIKYLSNSNCIYFEIFYLCIRIWQTLILVDRHITIKGKCYAADIKNLYCNLMSIIVFGIRVPKEFSFQVMSLEWMRARDPNGLFSATSDGQKIDQKLHKPVPTSRLKLSLFIGKLRGTLKTTNSTFVFPI